MEIPVDDYVVQSKEDTCVINQIDKHWSGLVDEGEEKVAKILAKVNM